MVSTSTILRGSTAALCLIVSGTAYAQGVPAQPAVASPLDDIVVTARRQAENAQTVPVTIIALGSEELRTKQVFSLGDLTRTAPGIQFVTQGGAGSINIVLRGLAKPPSGDVPGSVITYFGDVPIPTRGSDIPVYDLENIQVLKGPQGTLFGRNSIGGAVLIVPAKPTYTTEGYVRAAIGNYDYRDLEGALNVPIVADQIALRLAGKISRRDGFYKNPRRPNNRLAEVDRESLRGSLLIEPTENIRNTTVVDYFHANEAPDGHTLDVVFNTGTLRTPAFASFYDCHTVNAFNPVACVGFQPYADIDDALTQVQTLGRRTQPTFVDHYLRRKFLGIQNRTEITLGGVQLNNILSYRSTRLDSLGSGSGLGLGPPGFLLTNIRDDKVQFTEELQLVGDLFDDRLHWLVGGFYLRDRPSGPNFNSSEVARPASVITSYFSDSESKAVYAQFSFDVTQDLKLNAGYRHTWDRIRTCSVSTPVANGKPTFGYKGCRAMAPGGRVDFKDDAPTYTVGLDWQITPDVFGYVTHRRSFRVGGVNSPIFNTPGSDFLAPFQQYGPETVRDVEVGVKTQWNVGDVRGRFNVAAFRMWDKDFHTFRGATGPGGVPTGDPGTPLNNAINFNAGERRFTGGEAELVIQPAPTLSLEANLAYVKQKVLSLGIPAGLLARFPLNTFPAVSQLSPKFLMTVSGRWELPLRPFDGKLTFHADYYRQSSFEVTVQRFPAYDVSNLRLELSEIADSGASVTFFMRNVFDQANRLSGGANNSSLGFFSVRYNEPRMYGLEIGYKF